MPHRPKIVITKAKELGFCFGVRRAIKIIEEASKNYENIATLGPIVHNQQVVSRLAEEGISVIKDLNEIKGDTVAISSHGISPKILSDIQLKKLKIIDTTCPNVKRAQKAAQKLFASGFSVIIFGEANHPEVKGLLGWTNNKGIVMLNKNDLSYFNIPKKLGVLSQTTQSSTKFTDFIKEVITIAFPQVTELRIVNTLCQETRKRQIAALDLAKASDVVIVVGGLNSANTKHLAEICSTIVETHLIEDAKDIQKEWLKDKYHIGVTAGASTPDEAINEVISKLKELTDLNN